MKLPVSPLITAALFCTLCFGVPALLLIATPHFALTYVAGLPAALIVLSALFLSALASSGEPRFVSVTFWIFCYVFLGLTPLLQIVSNEFAWEETFNAESIVAGYLVIAVGIVGFIIGNKTQLLSPLFRFQRARRPVVISAPWTVVFCLVAVASIAIVGSNLGFEELIVLPRDETTAELSVIAEEDSVLLLLIFTLMRIPLFIVAITATAYVLRSKLLHGTYSPSGSYQGRLVMFLLIVAWIVTLLLSNPVNTARYFVGAIYLSAFFVVLQARWSPQRTTVSIVFIILVLLFMFPVIDVFRISLEETSVVSGLEELVDLMVHKGDFDAAQQIFRAVDYVDEYGLALGQQLLGTLLFWVPRVLWPTKPQPTGVLLADSASYDFTNLSCPLWAEAFVDFGFVGVLVLFMFYGKFVDVLETAYLSTLRSTRIHFVSLLVPIYAAYQIFLLRGTLMSAFAYLSPFLLFLFLLLRRTPEYQWIPGKPAPLLLLGRPLARFLPRR